ncbi:hypothetical protein K9M74_05005 [Candidatus Woesearchaeota archaeon]|nr:hypothetical protein [Candidatus Woesearchaeota archaeon]
MKTKNPEKLITTIITIIILFWSTIFVPALIMVVLLFSGYQFTSPSLQIQNPILYYNIIIFPAIICITNITSWLLLKKRKYQAALVVSLLPLLNVFIELVLADIALVVG